MYLIPFSSPSSCCLQAIEVAACGSIPLLEFLAVTGPGSSYGRGSSQSTRLAAKAAGRGGVFGAPTSANHSTLWLTGRCCLKAYHSLTLLPLSWTPGPRILHSSPGRLCADRLSGSRYTPCKIIHDPGSRSSSAQCIPALTKWPSCVNIV
jgi:hypothetical protein